MSSTPPSHSPPSVEKHGKNKAQKWARFTPSDSRNGQHQLSPIPLHCCSEDAPDFWELGPSWSVCSEDAPDFWCHASFLRLSKFSCILLDDSHITQYLRELGPSWSVCSEDAPDFSELGPSWSFSSLGEWRYLEEPPDFWELGPDDAAEACRESQFREAAIPFVHFHETPVYGHLHRVFCWCILCLSLFCSNSSLNLSNASFFAQLFNETQGNRSCVPHIACTTSAFQLRHTTFHWSLVGINHMCLQTGSCCLCWRGKRNSEHVSIPAVYPELWIRWWWLIVCLGKSTSYLEALCHNEGLDLFTISKKNQPFSNLSPFQISTEGPRDLWMKHKNLNTKNTTEKKKKKLVGGWTNPIWKICERQNGFIFHR